MIDIHTETLFRLRDARNLAWLKGRRGGRVDLSTLRRWSLRGIRGAVLETVRIGGSVFTSADAVERFVSTLRAPGQVASHPDGHRLGRIAAADHQLDKAR